MISQKAFTLLELILVIIILGVLVALGLPQFYKVIERARATEALSNIGSLRSAMERCALMNNGKYWYCALNTAPGENTIGFDDPGAISGSHFTYSITPHPSGRAYAITARRTAVDGSAQTTGQAITLGFGCRATVGADGNTVGYIWDLDDIFHWDAADIYKSVIPKN